MALASLNHRLRALPESTQGWMVCIAVLVHTIVRTGMMYSFGEFVVKLESRSNHTGMAVQNWIGTSCNALSMLLSPFSVLLIRTLGNNGYQIVALLGISLIGASCMLSAIVIHISELLLFLTYSLLSGIGLSLTYMSSSLVIFEHFDRKHKYHVLATSVFIMAGTPIGSLLYNPLNGWLVGSYGLRIPFIINGCIILFVCLPCSLLYLPKLDADTNEPADYGEYRKRFLAGCNPRQWLMRPEIALWLLGNLTNFMGFFIPFVNLGHYLKQMDIGLSRSKWAPTVTSLAECITYFAASAVGDLIKGRLILSYLLTSAGLCAIYFVWPFVDNSYLSIMILSTVLGAFIGLSLVYQFAASSEITKLPSDVAWPATNFWSAIGVLIGPLCSGLVFDHRHNYHDVWLVFGGLYCLQLLVFAAIPIVWLCRMGSAVSDAHDYIELNGDSKDDPKCHAAELNETSDKYSYER